MLLRRIATGRGAAVTALAAAAVAACLALGWWQWERSRPLADVLAAAPVPTEQVVPARGRLLAVDQGRPVTLIGQWRPDRQLLVADRRDPAGSGRTGRWVVTAVRVTEPADMLIPVVRGWVGTGRSPQDVPAPPAGRVSLTGWVQASEPLDNRADLVQPPGVAPLLGAADLVNRWPEDVADVFVIAAAAGAEGRDVAVGTESAMPGPVQVAAGTRDWRNVMYAVQWVVFAAAAGVVWWLAMHDLVPLPGGTGRTGSPGGPGRTETTAGDAPRERRHDEREVAP